MKILGLLFCLSVMFCAPAFVHGQEFIDGVDLTTTKAPWTMRLLGNDLDITSVQAKPDEASAYFMMSSASTKLNVSVFIEPVNKCKTSEECRDNVLNAGNPAWGKFEQLAKGKIKDFSYFEFYRPEVQGQPVKMLDVYAEYVSDGFWIDLHISKVLYSKADHALLEKVINSIEFVPRNASKDSAFDLQITNVQKAAGTWLALWDNGCKGSYEELSSVTRKRVGDLEWFGYCIRYVQDLGKNRSRKPIAVAYPRSTRDLMDRPLAIHAYHSSFVSKPSVVEMVALFPEKDGKWSVTSYAAR